MYSALILAGGKGSRLGYREKALIDIKGRPLIAIVIEMMEKAVDNIIISVRDREQGELLDSRLSGLVKPSYTFAYDAYKERGPLAGILSGLEACRDEYCFIAACDMPFINKDVVKMLLRECEHYDAAVPHWEDGFLEPLHAVYRRKPMIRETKKAIERGETIILAPVFELNVNYVAVDDIRKLDPELRTFININTYEDIEKLSEMF
ncbi:MAG: molybdenum cofactor guanylyltransferase [Candidatus Methanoperedens sp.]|nr:molybdenum cofactor guanylyltransferase [Candidatus Methanoperedens sp.]